MAVPRRGAAAVAVRGHPLWEAATDKAAMSALLGRPAMLISILGSAHGRHPRAMEYYDHGPEAPSISMGVSAKGENEGVATALATFQTLRPSRTISQSAKGRRRDSNPCNVGWPVRAAFSRIPLPVPPARIVTGAAPPGAARLRAAAGGVGSWPRRPAAGGET